MTIYELLGFVSTLICVWLNKMENIWGWFFGILASAFYFIVFYNIQLYGDMILQVIFIVISFYGWYQWLYGGRENTEITISNFPKKHIVYLLIVFAVAVSGLVYFLRFLNSDIVYLDAITTVVSLIAQWMMAKKYLENWLLWIFANLIYIGMYFYKEIYLTSFLYFILVILAIWGYYSWKKYQTHYNLTNQ